MKEKADGWVIDKVEVIWDYEKVNSVGIVLCRLPNYVPFLISLVGDANSLKKIKDLVRYPNLR